MDFVVTRIVKQIFTIKAKDKKDAEEKLLTTGTPKGFFETHIISEKVKKLLITPKKLFESRIISENVKKLLSK